MEFSTSPYLLKDTSVRRVMTQVLLALVPGIVAYALLIGPLTQAFLPWTVVPLDPPPARSTLGA